MLSAQSSSAELPDALAIRDDLLRAGGLDPASLRFRVVEYEKTSGDFIGVPEADLGFIDAVTRVQSLLAFNDDRHFCIEPVGFVQ